MLHDILGYIRATGAEVLVYDDPKNGYLGYATKDLTVQWQIPLLLIAHKGLPVNFGGITLEGFRTALQSAAGRQSIIANIVAQSKRGTITDSDYIAHLEKQWHDRVDAAPRTPPTDLEGHVGWKVEIPPGSDGRQ
jgi:hypothetical protein